MKVNQQYITIGYLLQQEGASHCHNAERHVPGRVRLQHCLECLQVFRRQRLLDESAIVATLPEHRDDLGGTVLQASLQV